MHKSPKLAKLQTVVMYDLRTCIKEDNPGVKGGSSREKNYVRGTGVSVVI